MYNWVLHYEYCPSDIDLQHTNTQNVEFLFIFPAISQICNIIYQCGSNIVIEIYKNIIGVYLSTW